MTRSLYIRMLLGSALAVLLLGTSLSLPDRLRKPVWNAGARLDTIVAADVRTLATFDDARALAVDPRGRLYVADAGRDVVAILDTSGTVLQMLGGSGVRPGRFTEPTDIDPTNGLQLLVADAGNGRLQRFSSEGQFLESLPVRRPTATGSPRSVVEQDRESFSANASGRPTAVVSTSDQDIFALDGRHRTLLRWDSARRVEVFASADAAGPVALRTPVALALDATRRLYVADGGATAILVFDRFGTFVRRLDLPEVASSVRALTIHDGSLWIVRPQSLTARSPATGRVLQSQIVHLHAPLVDVAFDGARLYLLTATHLMRVQ